MRSIPCLLRICVLVFSSVTLVLIAAEQTDSKTWNAHIKPFMQKYCIECHKQGTAKAGLRLDDLNGDMISDSESAEIWNEVRDRMNLGEMPPKKALQPSNAEAQKTISWITDELAKARRAARHSDHSMLIRRLTQREYGLTIDSLLGVTVDTSGLPPDGKVEGFDKVRSGLTLSPLHLEQYLLVGERALQQAIDDRPTRPSTELWRLETRRLDQPRWTGRGLATYDTSLQLRRGGDPKLSLEQRHPSFNVKDANGKNKRHGLRAVGPNRPEYFRGEWVSIANRVENGRIDFGVDNFLVRETGIYRIRVRARCNVNERLWPLGMPTLQIRPVVGAKAYLESGFAEAGTAQIFSVDVHLKRGQRFGVKLVSAGFDEDEIKRKKLRGRPGVQADWLEIEGPIFPFAGWPSPTQKRLLADWHPKTDDPKALRHSMQHFISEAFRRPAKASEVDLRMAIYKQAKAAGDTPYTALRMAWLSVLASPQFLYLAEPHSQGGQISQHELASRLSYFLWSRPPDKELRASADAGKLSDTAELARQTKRLLADPRAHAFVEHFTDQWLNLEALEGFAPDVGIFPTWDEDLRHSMRAETRATIADLLHGGRPLEQFLASDQVIINERLAAHYGIRDVIGPQLRRVAVPDGVQRGGLLTQASVHCLTSNGTRTSPVHRGVYILEHILGSPPPPPPPNAGEIANKVPGADKITVRERLRLHREVESCAACHNKIDPLGFALENYDGIGRWRHIEFSGDHLVPATVGGPVDPSAVLPDGTAISGYKALSSWLQVERDRFAHCLTEKLLVYSLGRLPSFTDTELIEGIVAASRSQANSMRDIIIGIVQSRQFRHR